MAKRKREDSPVSPATGSSTGATKPREKKQKSIQVVYELADGSNSVSRSLSKDGTLNKALYKVTSKLGVSTPGSVRLVQVRQEGREVEIYDEYDFMAMKKRAKSTGESVTVKVYPGRVSVDDARAQTTQPPKGAPTKSQPPTPTSTKPKTAGRRKSKVGVAEASAPSAAVTPARPAAPPPTPASTSTKPAKSTESSTKQRKKRKSTSSEPSAPSTPSAPPLAKVALPENPSYMDSVVARVLNKYKPARPSPLGRPDVPAPPPSEPQETPTKPRARKKRGRKSEMATEASAEAKGPSDSSPQPKAVEEVSAPKVETATDEQQAVAGPSTPKQPRQSISIASAWNLYDKPAEPQVTPDYSSSSIYSPEAKKSKTRDRRNKAEKPAAPSFDEEEAFFNSPVASAPAVAGPSEPAVQTASETPRRKRKPTAVTSSTPTETPGKEVEPAPVSTPAPPAPPTSTPVVLTAPETPSTPASATKGKRVKKEKPAASTPHLAKDIMARFRAKMAAESAQQEAEAEKAPPVEQPSSTEPSSVETEKATEEVVEEETPAEKAPEETPVENDTEEVAAPTQPQPSSPPRSPPATQETTPAAASADLPLIAPSPVVEEPDEAEGPAADASLEVTVEPAADSSSASKPFRYERFSNLPAEDGKTLRDRSVCILCGEQATHIQKECPIVKKGLEALQSQRELRKAELEAKQPVKRRKSDSTVIWITSSLEAIENWINRLTKLQQKVEGTSPKVTAHPFWGQVAETEPSPQKHVQLEVEPSPQRTPFALDILHQKALARPRRPGSLSGLSASDAVIETGESESESGSDSESDSDSGSGSESESGSQSGSESGSSQNASLSPTLEDPEAIFRAYLHKPLSAREKKQARMSAASMLPSQTLDDISDPGSDADVDDDDEEEEVLPPPRTQRADSESSFGDYGSDEDVDQGEAVGPDSVSEVLSPEATQTVLPPSLGLENVPSIVDAPASDGSRQSTRSFVEMDREAGTSPIVDNFDGSRALADAIAEDEGPEVLVEETMVDSERGVATQLRQDVDVTPKPRRGRSAARLDSQQSQESSVASSQQEPESHTSAPPSQGLRRSSRNIRATQSPAPTPEPAADATPTDFRRRLRSASREVAEPSPRVTRRFSREPSSLPPSSFPAPPASQVTPTPKQNGNLRRSSRSSQAEPAPSVDEPGSDAEGSTTSTLRRSARVRQSPLFMSQPSQPLATQRYPVGISSTTGESSRPEASVNGNGARTTSPIPEESEDDDGAASEMADGDETMITSDDEESILTTFPTIRRPASQSYIPPQTFMPTLSTLDTSILRMGKPNGGMSASQPAPKAKPMYEESESEVSSSDDDVPAERKGRYATGSRNKPKPKTNGVMRGW